MNQPWLVEEREIRGEIMKTDVFVRLCAPTADFPETQFRTDFEQCLTLFRDFEARYSRFLPESVLSCFNRSAEWQADEEFFDILARAKEYWTITEGVFNPTILPVLEQSGYPSVPDQSSASNNTTDTTSFPLSELMLDPETRMIRKPLNLRIDLGGIGKGYCVDKVARFLESGGYEDFLIDAGGDMRAGGVNRENGQSIPWHIAIEHPLDETRSIATIPLRDQSVATSGRNRRHWTINHEERHHLINPKIGTSETTRLMTVTVISTTTTDADVWAKTLFLLGETAGILKAEQQRIPACFTFDDGSHVFNSFFQPYVQTEHLR